MFLGIDVSKATLDVALVKDEKKPRHKVFANSAAGHQQLLQWLKDSGATAVHACLEATGTFAEAVTLSLADAGHRVSVVNPAQIHHFAQTNLSRTKTDKVDAQNIARFCQLHQPPLWEPPAPQIRTLQALVRRLESLLQMQTAEKNRLAAGPTSPEVLASIQTVFAFLEREITTLRTQIREHINSHPDLKGKRDLLTSIPGIADTSAAAILAELGDVTQFTRARQVAAFAGLVPKIRHSGSSVRGRATLSKRGSPRLRHALYFPAMTALRFNPLIRALRDRLKERGKAKMAILGAAMRKLLHIVFGVLKSGKPFNPNILSVAAAAPA
jgi:transposase